MRVKRLLLHCFYKIKNKLGQFHLHVDLVPELLQTFKASVSLIP
jgi:hypothetical protein